MTKNLVSHAIDTKIQAPGTLDLASLATVRPWLVEHARARCGSTIDAEDIAQEALQIAVCKWLTFAPSRGVLRAWVWGIARTVILQRRRAHRDRRRFERAFALTLGSTAPDASGPVEARALLRALRDATTGPRWEAWFAHAAEGRTVPEIAARAGLPLTTIVGRIHAARKDFVPVVAALEEDGV